MEPTASGLIYPDAEHWTLEFLEEVRPNIYHSAYKLKGFPFADRLDMYAVIEPGERALFIDTGWFEINGTECMDELLRRFGIPWEKVEVFITHFHIDHEGNLDYCIKNGARIVYHGPHMDMNEERIDRFMVQTGAARKGDEGVRRNVRSVGGRLNHPHSELTPPTEYTLTEFDAIRIAGYTFRPIATPGHAPDHMCLFETNEHFVFSGDHITHGGPGVYQYFADEQTLMRYLQSFPRLRAMRLGDVYMAHHAALSPEEAKAMMDQIEGNYTKPLAKAYRQLEEAGRPITAYEATEINNAHRKGGIMFFDNDMRCRKIATQFGYLEYLHDTGEIQRVEAEDGAMLYYV